jgi:hypothetical protein
MVGLGRPEDGVPSHVYGLLSRLERRPVSLGGITGLRGPVMINSMIAE